MITFVGGYVVGMGMALVAVMFFSGIKRSSEDYEQARRVPVRMTHVHRNAKQSLKTDMSGRAAA